MLSKLAVITRFRWGIAPILTLSMVGVIVLLMTLVTLVDIRRERGIFRDEQEERGTLLVRGTSDILADYFYFADVDALRDISARIVQSEPDVEYVQMLDPNGSLLAASSKEGGGQDYPTVFAAEPLGIVEARSGQTTHKFDGDRLEVANPISAGREVVGVL